MTQVATRNRLRQRRRALPEKAQRLAADKLASQLCQLNLFKFSHRLAFYLANDGEINPALCMSIAQAANKQCYLPVLKPLNAKQLLFAEHQPTDTLAPNRYGINEPPLNSATIVPTWSLDVIFLPLVAFDDQCNRLGMGGGYYDRTLSVKAHQQKSRPLLVGLAHHSQQVESLAANPWDIPMDYVVTDHNVFLNPSKMEP